MENSPKFRYFVIKNLKLNKTKSHPKGKNVSNLVTLSVGVSRCATPLPACFQLKFFAGKPALFDF
jgi:hypothetical protein